jgi:hypothetical protein
VVESYKHQFAKQTLARWLADPEQKLVLCENTNAGGLNGRGVYTEYPFCLRSNGKLIGSSPWHETGWIPSKTDVPTYQECLDAEMLPICIFDVAIEHRGFISLAFEIVHKHEVTAEKRAYIQRIIHHGFLRCVYGLSADWVLSQVGLPEKCSTLWKIEG